MCVHACSIMMISIPVSVSKTPLRRRIRLGQLARRSPNQGLEKSLCCCSLIHLQKKGIHHVGGYSLGGAMAYQLQGRGSSRRNVFVRRHRYHGWERPKLKIRQRRGAAETGCSGSHYVIYSIIYSIMFTGFTGSIAIGCFIT